MLQGKAAFPGITVSPHNLHVVIGGVFEDYVGLVIDGILLCVLGGHSGRLRRPKEPGCGCWGGTLRKNPQMYPSALASMAVQMVPQLVHRY